MSKFNLQCKATESIVIIKANYGDGTSGLKAQNPKSWVREMRVFDRDNGTKLRNCHFEKDDNVSPSDLMHVRDAFSNHLKTYYGWRQIAAEVAERLEIEIVGYGGGEPINDGEHAMVAVNSGLARLSHL